MARTGIFKWDVKDARDQLIREGKHPSIDAIRSALGDTGSKSTIHRFLKELDEEEAGSSKIAISDALQGLVSQLSERLLHEGQVEIEAAAARFAAERATLKAEITAASQDAKAVRAELAVSAEALAAERAERATIATALQNEQLQVARLTEQAKAYEQRLAELASHQKSLEEKHENARQALEHFRAAAKEQREQELRRHDHQVQQLQTEVRALNSTLTEKLSQLTQISSNAAALSAEVASTRQQLRDSQSGRERLEQEAGHLRDTISKAGAERIDLDRRLAETRSAESTLRGRLAEVEEIAKQREISNARSEALLDSQKARCAQLEQELQTLRHELASKAEALAVSAAATSQIPALQDTQHVE